ncbi:NUDIX hydrolase [Desulfarculus baarsii]
MDELYTPRLLAVGQALQEALAWRRPLEIVNGKGRPAGVLMPLWDDGQAVQMIFTKRSSELPQHAGQVSFPGGMSERGDRDLAHTALRETHEEIGVPMDQIKVLSRLDQLQTITGFVVTPFLGLVASGATFQVNPVEVDRLLLAPLAKVLDRNNYRQMEVDWDGMKFSQMALPHDGDVIWGATFRMLQNFVESLGGRVEAIIAAAGAGRAQKEVDRAGGLVY